MSDQRRRRWADVVQMLYKCFALAGHADGTDCNLTNLVPTSTGASLYEMKNLECA